MGNNIREFLELENLNKQECLNILAKLSMTWDTIKKYSSNLELIIDKEVEYTIQKVKVYCLEIVYNMDIDLSIINMFIKESKDIITKIEEENFKISNNCNLQLC